MLDTNDLTMGIRQAQEDIKSYYILGYYSKNTAEDGKYRRIDVRLVNKDLSAKLDFRKGYYSSKVWQKFNAADKERQLEEALTLGDPVNDLPLALEVDYLPGHEDWIRELAASLPTPDFHPRFQAKRKTYEYRICRSEICSPFDRRYVCHHPYPLSTDEMIRLAPLLEGEHDFAAFAASDERDELELSRVRSIYCSRLVLEGEVLTYRVTGSGFLKHMVRNIVGVLLEVGKGNVDRASFLARLEPGCKIPPGPTAPARGLFLVSVEY